MPTTRLKRNAVVVNYDPKLKLKSRTFILQALASALMEGDAPAFKEILMAHLSVLNKESFYKKAGISRRTLFRILSPDGNPTLSSITSVVKAL